MRNTQDTRVRHAFVLHFVHHFLGFICSVSSLANSVYNLFDSQSTIYSWYGEIPDFSIILVRVFVWSRTCDGSATPLIGIGETEFVLLMWAETFFCSQHQNFFHADTSTAYVALRPPQDSSSCGTQATQSYLLLIQAVGLSHCVGLLSSYRVGLKAVCGLERPGA